MLSPARLLEKTGFSFTGVQVSLLLPLWGQFGLDDLISESIPGKGDEIIVTGKKRKGKREKRRKNREKVEKREKGKKGEKERQRRGGERIRTV